MKSVENLERLLEKFKSRYGNHDALVLNMQKELDELKRQIALRPHDRYSSRKLGLSTPISNHQR